MGQLHIADWKPTGFGDCVEHRERDILGVRLQRFHEGVEEVVKCSRRAWNRVSRRSSLSEARSLTRSDSDIVNQRSPALANHTLCGVAHTVEDAPKAAVRLVECHPYLCLVGFVCSSAVVSLEENESWDSVSNGVRGERIPSSLNSGVPPITTSVMGPSVPHNSTTSARIPEVINVVCAYLPMPLSRSCRTHTDGVEGSVVRIGLRKDVKEHYSRLRTFGCRSE